MTLGKKEITSSEISNENLNEPIKLIAMFEKDESDLRGKVSAILKKLTPTKESKFQRM